MSEIVWKHRCMIVPAPDAPMARALCAGLTPGDSGKGMFSTPLSVTGAAPVSHYITSGMIDEVFAALLPLKAFGADGQAVITPGQPQTIVSLAGGAVTLGQVNALLNAVDVTEQDPFAALGRLGLQLVQEAA